MPDALPVIAHTLIAPAPASLAAAYHTRTIVKVPVPFGPHHHRLVALLLAEHGARHRRLHADEALRRIELVGADDPELEALARLVLERDPGAEEHPARLLRRLGHHLELVEPLREEVHAPVDLAQPLLAVDVLGVLRAIPQRRRVRDLPRHARPLDLPEPLELGRELAVAVGGDVAGHALAV